jgi:hypothetical protein
VGNRSLIVNRNVSLCNESSLHLPPFHQQKKLAQKLNKHRADLVNLVVSKRLSGNVGCKRVIFGRKWDFLKCNVLSRIGNVGF